MSDIQRGIEGLSQITAEEALKRTRARLDYSALEAAGFKVRSLTIKEAEFDAFLSEVDYEVNFPQYVSAFSRAYERTQGSAELVNAKFFEQFLGIHLTNPGVGHVTVDIAAAFGVMSSILFRRGVKTSYHQDLNQINAQRFPYLNDVEMIVSNASELPFKENSIDYMYLLNSWEHFQAPSDLETLIEAERCLAKGGKVVIVPLNGASKAFVRTDVDLWNTKQVYEAGKDPNFRTDVDVEVGPCRQVYAQRHDAELLAEFARRTPNLSYEIVCAKLDVARTSVPKNGMDVLIATRR